MPDYITPEEEPSTTQSLLSMPSPTVGAGTLEKPSDVIEQPTAQKGASFITPESTVQRQLSDILAAGSPLQTLAEQKSKEEAQRKGLLSSSMAVGAGQKAVIESALPIAQQDAEAYRQAQMREQEQAGLLQRTGYEADITAALAGTQGQIKQVEQERQIQAQKDIVQLQESEAGRRLTEELTTRERMSADDISARLQMSYNEIQSRLDISDAELRNQLAIETARLNAADRENLITSIEPMTTGYNNAVAAIQSVPTSQLSTADKQMYLDYQREQYMNQVDMLASIYNADIEWELPSAEFVPEATETTETAAPTILGTPTTTWSDTIGVQPNGTVVF